MKASRVCVYYKQIGMLRFSKISYVLAGFLFLVLLAVDCSDSNSEVKDGLEHNSPLIANVNGRNNANEQKVEANSGSDPKIVAPLKKEEQVENPKQVIQNDLLKSNASNTLESKDGIGKVPEDSSNVGFTTRDKQTDNIGGSKEGSNPKQVTVKDTENGNTRGSEGDNSKQVMNKDKESSSIGGSKGDSAKQVTDQDKESGNTGASEEGDSNQVPTKDGNRESSDSSIVVKENPQDDECDPSNMCVDKIKNFTACFRVPGNDSPDLSLHIRNQGSKPVSISITAPAFVQLEEKKVQLQPKEDRKVRVSIAYEGMDSLIYLTTEDSRCTLNFRDLVPHDARVEAHYAFKLRYLNNWTKSHLIIFLALSTFLVFGCAWMYFGLHKKLNLGNGYQAVEMELPVSGPAGKTVSETNGGWDNSWDDNWDDEEAPMTPTLPATPNLSSRGLASRRLGKEGWKD